MFVTLARRTVEPDRGDRRAAAARRRAAGHAGHERSNAATTDGGCWRKGREERGEGREGKHKSSPPSPRSPLPSPLSFDALILATPSPVTAALLQPLDAALAADLASIEHSGTAILSLGYRSDAIGHPLDGMGAVVPAVERSPILAVSFSSRKYAHRAPEGKTLLRVFVGGARRPEVAAMSDAELTPLVLGELSPACCGFAASRVTAT